MRSTISSHCPLDIQKKICYTDCVGIGGVTFLGTQILSESIEHVIMPTFLFFVHCALYSCIGGKNSLRVLTTHGGCDILFTKGISFNSEGTMLLELLCGVSFFLSHLASAAKNSLRVLTIHGGCDILLIRCSEFDRLHLVPSWAR